RLINITAPMANHVEQDGTTAWARPTTTYSYDGEDLKTKQIDPLGRVTNFEYDGMFRLTETIQPSTLQFVAAGQELQESRPDTVNTYDRNGNLETVKDPLGRVTTYAYDERNLRTSQTLPDPGTGDHGPSVTTYAYDSVGNLATVEDARNHV